MIEPKAIPLDGNMNLYPNPSTGQIQLDYELPGLFESGTLDLCDINGKVIRSVQIEEHKNSLTLNLSDFPSGKYLFILRDQGGNQVSEKLVKL